MEMDHRESSDLQSPQQQQKSSQEEHPNGTVDHSHDSTKKKDDAEECHPVQLPSPIIRSVAGPGATFFGVRFSKNQLVVGGSLSILFIGVTLGMTLEPVGEDPAPWDRISSVIGWWYFMAWAVSFLPQIYLNYTRKCVIGQSFDYLFLNVLGFACYSVYTVSFHYVKSVQDEYQARFHSQNTVDLNDVVFAVYAFLMCVYNGWQVYVYERGDQRIHPATLIAIALTVLVFAVWYVTIVAGVNKEYFFNDLDLLYGLSMVKLGVTVVKYIPQIYLNYTRQLTVGWNIWNVLLDFTGGTLSIVQLLIDCGTTGRWNGLIGNPIKFCLGSMSMVYDIIFMLQHYVFYKENNERLGREVGLLDDAEEDCGAHYSRHVDVKTS